MKRSWIGIGIGFCLGILDVIPMILKKLPWDANLGALTLWTIAGFFMATSSLKLNPIIRGILVSFMCFLPSSVFIIKQDPWSLAPISIAIILLGGFGGFIINRLTIELD